MADPREHWEAVYRRDTSQVSWHQDEARLSLELIDRLGLSPDDPIIDIGGGASPLAAGLLARGHRDVTVLDISEQALGVARADLAERAEQVTWICADLLAWQPSRRYRLWHDRAVLHFLVDRRDQETYVTLLGRALASGGDAVIATFAADGPERCSGLPVVRYRPEDLAELLGAGFEITVTRREIHHTPGGSAQPFSWVVARHA